MKFTGHERDRSAIGTAAELDYMHARYYSPHWGRFRSVDPILQKDVALRRPGYWNRYSYGLSNPTTVVDRDGRVISFVFLSPGEQQLLLRRLEQRSGLLLGIGRDGRLVIRGVNIDKSGVALGSRTARFDLIKAITQKKVVTVQSLSSPSVELAETRGRSLIRLDFDDISTVDPGSNDPATFDEAMIFLHELAHTAGSGDPSEVQLRLNPSLRGDVVNHINDIRTELGLPIRLKYSVRKVGNGMLEISFDSCQATPSFVLRDKATATFTSVVASEGTSWEASPARR